MTDAFDRERILGLFEELSQRLAARGARADLFLVGGAAMAVAYDARRATRDLDAVFVPTATVRAVAEEIAGEQGLAPDVVARAYPASRILPKTQYLLGEIVEDLNARSADRPAPEEFAP